MLQIFLVLEPEAQKGMAAIIGKLHKKKLTAADFLAQAAVLIAAQNTAS